jgi:hypothetical protein
MHHPTTVVDHPVHFVACRFFFLGNFAAARAVAFALPFVGGEGGSRLISLTPKSIVAF